jgi:aerobic-type carbon monoxide dehydrogenase small subunit (CoxS/CutS family)
MIEGEAVRSCQTPVSKVGGRAVTTQEGLGSPENPHKVQAAFIAEQAAQCEHAAHCQCLRTERGRQRKGRIARRQRLTDY